MLPAPAHRRRFGCGVAMAAVLAAAPTCGYGTAATAEEDVRRRLPRAGVEHGFPGLSLHVDRGGRGTWSGAAGHARLRPPEPLTPEHAFHLASITKLFTAVATLRLVDEGRLSLDDRLGGLLDREVLAGLPHAGEIELRQLLDHHKPYGVVITAEGDGPGGSNTVLAYHPASDTIVVGLVNVFGLGDEAEFILDEIVPELVLGDDLAQQDPERPRRGVEHPRQEAGLQVAHPADPGLRGAEEHGHHAHRRARKSR